MLTLSNDRPREITDIETAPRIKGSDEKFCKDCGQVIAVRAEICPKCGVRQFAPPAAGVTLGPTTSSGRSRVAAAVFAILLGGLGVHKFYLGQIGMGFLYLIFCWTFIPAVVGFIEGIIYLTMSDEAFASKYG